MIKFVVTGCGQSGTHYTAAVLAHLGADVAHEAVFDRWNPGYDTMPDINVSRDGDVSYIAVPFLGRFIDPDSESDPIPVLQVRPPLDQMRSTLGRGFINAARPLPWVRFLHHHIGLLDVPAGPERAARYWLDWNWLALRELHSPPIIFRLHDPTEMAAEVKALSAVADLASPGLGIGWSEIDIADAMDEIPTDLGSKARAESFTLDDLRPDTLAEVEALAAKLDVPLSMAEAG